MATDNSVYRHQVSWLQQSIQHQ